MWRPAVGGGHSPAAARARAVLALQLVVGLLGIGVVALAAVVAAGQISLALPDVGALVDHCQAVLLPSPGLAGVWALALGALAFAVLGVGLRSALSQVRRTRRFLRGPAFPTRARLAGHEVVLIDDRRPLAFCAGLVDPRIYVSTATLDALDDEQLAAVVAHEAYHARQRDPLRVLVARVLADALFFLPAARRLGERYADLAELAADREALRASDGRPAPLASALLSLEAADPAVVGIAPERVDQLMGEGTGWDLPLALLAGAAATLGALLAVTLRVEAAAGMAINLPLLLAQSCMLVMAVAPPAFGALAILHARRRRLRLRAAADGVTVAPD